MVCCGAFRSERGKPRCVEGSGFEAWEFGLDAIRPRNQGLVEGSGFEAWEFGLDAIRPRNQGLVSEFLGIESDLEPVFCVLIPEVENAIPPAVENVPALWKDIALTA